MARGTLGLWTDTRPPQSCRICLFLRQNSLLVAQLRPSRELCLDRAIRCHSKQLSPHPSGKPLRSGRTPPPPAPRARGSLSRSPRPGLSQPSATHTCWSDGRAPPSPRHDPLPSVRHVSSASSPRNFRFRMTQLPLPPAAGPPGLGAASAAPLGGALPSADA